MTMMPESAAPAAHHATSSGPVEETLALADSLVTSLQQGVAGQAWAGLPALADQLQHSLERLDAGLRILAVTDPGRAARLAPSLAEVAARHAVVLERLTAARDQTAAELASVLQGHSGATQYLHAAEGS